MERKEEEPGTEGGSGWGKGARPWFQVPGALSKPAESSPMKVPKKKKGGWKGRSVSYKGTGPSKMLDFPIPRIYQECQSVHLSREEATIPAYPAVIPLKSPLEDGYPGARPLPKEIRESGLEKAALPYTFPKMLFRE